MASSSSIPPSEGSETGSPAPSGKKRRRAITDAQRKDLRVHGQALIRENGKWTTPQMVDFFDKKYDRILSQSTISESLSNTFKHLDEQDHPLRPESKKRAKTKWPDLEAALFEWQQRAFPTRNIIPNERLISTAKEIYKRLPQYHGVEPPAFSTHWLSDYKARYKIKKDQEVVGTELEDLREILKTYKCEDIYNMDETTLLWKMCPDDTLMRESKAGGKLEKARITVNLACNVTGTRKLPPWIIGRAQSPRCFSGSGVFVGNFPMVWRYNGKAWMTGAMFEEYLRWFDSQMAGRKVCLLIDEFSAHKAGMHFMHLASPEGLTNTTVLFLPTSTTPVCQPLDQGIIQSWKAHYRRRWLEYMCNEYDERRDPMKSMNVLQAIRWVIAAWEVDITPITIRDCWIKSRVLGPNYVPQPEGWEIAVHTDVRMSNDNMTQVEQRIKSLVQQKLIRSAMNTATFVNPHYEIIDDNDEDIFESIIEIYSTGGDGRDQETDEEDVRVERIEDEEALVLLSRLRLYEEQQEDGDDVIISRLNKYEKDIRARQSWDV